MARSLQNLGQLGEFVSSRVRTRFGRGTDLRVELDDSLRVHERFFEKHVAELKHAAEGAVLQHREGIIERGPGRHGVSNAFFVYLRDPDGHRVELYTGDYYTGDPDHEPIRWSASDARRRTFWGHHVPDSWYEEGSLVRGADGRAAELAEPILDERLVAVE